MEKSELSVPSSPLPRSCWPETYNGSKLVGQMFTSFFWVAASCELVTELLASPKQVELVGTGYTSSDFWCPSAISLLENQW